MKTKERLQSLIIIVVIIGLWLFFRKPVWLGEIDATRLIQADQKTSHENLDAMTEEMRRKVNDNTWEKTGASLLFLENGGRYYAMRLYGGAMFPIDEEGFPKDELFRLNKFVCGIKNGSDENICFISGKIVTRHPRGLYLFIDSSVGIWVMTDIQYWEYEFRDDKLSEIDRGTYKKT